MFLFLVPVLASTVAQSHGCQCGLLTDCCRLITDYLRQPSSCCSFTFSLAQCSRLLNVFPGVLQREVDSFYNAAQEKTNGLFILQAQIILSGYVVYFIWICSLYLTRWFFHRKWFQFMKCSLFDQLFPHWPPWPSPSDLVAEKVVQEAPVDRREASRRPIVLNATFPSFDLETTANGGERGESAPLKWKVPLQLPQLNQRGPFTLLFRWGCLFSLSDSYPFTS